MIADDRAWRESHAENAPWSARDAIRPDPHPVDDDRVFAAFGVLVTIAGGIGALYFAVRFAMAFFGPQ